jgi:transposase-like protein
MYKELQTMTQIQSSLDGDMHQYIQFIIKRSPCARAPHAQSTYKQVLQAFREQCPRCSPPYRRVFAKFYASRHSNHSEDAIQDFVAEVERQMRQGGGGTDL